MVVRCSCRRLRRRCEPCGQLGSDGCGDWSSDSSLHGRCTLVPVVAVMGPRVAAFTRVTEVSRVTRIARIVRVTRVAQVTHIPGVAMVTEVAGGAGIARVEAIAQVPKVARITGVKAVRWLTWRIVTRSRGRRSVGVVLLAVVSAAGRMVAVRLACAGSSLWMTTCREGTLVAGFAGHQPGVAHVDGVARVSKLDAALAVAHVGRVVGVVAVAKWAVGRFEDSLRPRLVLTAGVVFASVPHTIFAPLSTVIILIPPEAFTTALSFCVHAISVHMLPVQRAFPPATAFPVDRSTRRLNVLHFTLFPQAAASVAGPCPVLLQTFTLALAFVTETVKLAFPLSVQIPLTLTFEFQLTLTGAAARQTTVVVESLLPVAGLLPTEVGGVDDVLRLVDDVPQTPLRLRILLFLVFRHLNRASTVWTIFLDVHRLVVVGIEIAVLMAVMVEVVVGIAAALIAFRW